MNKKKIRLISLIVMCIEALLIITLVVLNLAKVIHISLYGWIWIGIAFYAVAVVFYFSLDKKDDTNDWH